MIGWTDFLMILFLGVIIIIDILEMKNLIIHIKKRKKEIFILISISLIIIILTAIYARKMIHYLVSVLLIVELILAFNKRGITKKGFNSITSLSRFQRWGKIESIEIYPDFNDCFKVSYRLDYLIGKESYYFEKEDYDRVIDIFKENLSHEKLKIIFK